MDEIKTFYAIQLNYLQSICFFSLLFWGEGGPAPVFLCFPSLFGNV